jgi:hypothetical protein
VSRLARPLAVSEVALRVVVPALVHSVRDPDRRLVRRAGGAVSGATLALRAVGIGVACGVRGSIDLPWVSGEFCLRSEL